MFKVDVDSLQAYLDFDPERKSDLQKLDALLKKVAPNLKRHFHAGTSAGEPGMRFKMIGYGKFSFPKLGAILAWPVIGVALQKNYISVYQATTKNGTPIAQTYAGRLGELRLGRNNFSFEKFDDLNAAAVAAMFAEAANIFKTDPENPVRYMQSIKR